MTTPELPTDQAPVPLEGHLHQFGLTAFRPGQREVIETVLAGSDCLCIMPTGGGKSLCYQLPSIARVGATLVISPLIALMKDQVDGLRARGFRATFINSSLDSSEQHARMQQMSAGEFDLIYIAPERLRNKVFQEALGHSKIQLLAVDEAHCISEWGHDFRPDYARLGVLRQRLGSPQTIALTATATPIVRRDIVDLLKLDDPQVFITGFARPNLHFEVRQAWGKAAKLTELLRVFDETPGAGIIYASTRKRCEQLAADLDEAGVKRRVAVYHAGLEPQARREVQESFMSGETQVIIATNAFGMGIDKRDLRFVVHHDLPGTLEAYYQEAGRGGRDGLDSRCLLLFNERDRDIQEYFIDNSYPPREAIAKVYDYLRKIDQDPIQLTLQELKDAIGLDISSEGVGACEKILEKADVLDRLDTRQNQAAVRLASDLPTLVDLIPVEAHVQRKVMRTLENLVGDSRHEYVYLSPAKLEAITELDRDAIARAIRALSKLDCFEYVPPFRGRAIHMKIRDVPFSKLKIDFAELDRRKNAEYDKLEAVIRYARSRTCRQLAILDYFGDPSKKKCDACDNCGGLDTITVQSPEGSEATLSISVQPVSAEAMKAAAQNSKSKTSEDPAQRIIQMALSGVARAGGRVGKTMVAKMLCGSNAKELKRQRFDELSTFGLLAHWKQTEVAELLDALISCRLIEQREQEKFRPLVTITESGKAVMRGERSVDVLTHLSSAVRAKMVGRGTSEVSAPAESQAEVVASHEVSEAASNPDWRWTWRLHADGYPRQEIAEIRRLSMERVLGDLAAAAQSGAEVDLTSILSAEQMELLASVCRDHRRVHVRELFEQLHGAALAEEIALFLAVRSVER